MRGAPAPDPLWEEHWAEDWAREGWDYWNGCPFSGFEDHYPSYRLVDEALIEGDLRIIGWPGTPPAPE